MVTIESTPEMAARMYQMMEKNLAVSLAPYEAYGKSAS